MKKLLKKAIMITICTIYFYLKISNFFLLFPENENEKEIGENEVNIEHDPKLNYFDDIIGNGVFS
jgi:hypothetical protein